MAFSQYDPHITLEKLRFDKEHQYLERKGIHEKGIKPTKIANELIGMLNADGGILVLGISDNGDIEDLNTLDPSMVDQYRKLIFEYIKPPASICLEEIILDTGELIFLYHVDQDYERVFTRADNEDVYLRISDSNKGPINRDQVRKLEYDKSIRRFEDEERPDFDTDDFRVSVLDFYKKRLGFGGTYDQLLLSRHLAVRHKDGRIVYKNAAILLFSEDPEKYIPSASLRYIRYNGNIQQTGSGGFNLVKKESITGCIPRIIELAKRVLSISIKDYYFLDMSQGKFVQVAEYPEEAWLEGIVNSLCHRSYNLQGNRVDIKHYDNRIEISNSGPLPAQVTVENIRDTRYARNPRIARVLTEMGYVQELNEGTNRIFQVMKDSFLPDPIYKNENNMVTLILENKVSQHDVMISDTTMRKIESSWKTFSPTEHLIIGYLFEKHKGTIQELCLAIPKTEQAIRTAINKLMDKNIITKNSEKLRDKNAIYGFTRDTI